MCWWYTVIYRHTGVVSTQYLYETTGPGHYLFMSRFSGPSSLRDMQTRTKVGHVGKQLQALS